jgi:hypothetical protein
MITTTVSSKYTATGTIEGPGYSLPYSSLPASIFDISRTASIAARRRARSALASREKCPCFQFARLLRSRPSRVRGPVLLPP